MSTPVYNPFAMYDCRPLWQIQQEERNKELREKITEDLKERLYIERRLAENGIDMNELEKESRAVIRKT